MAITFRGQASRLNKEAKSRNQVGFQDKSAAGDRQGVGGEDVSLKQAMGSFNKRNTSPAKKIGPQGLGVKGNNGYSVGSPAKKSCSPITQRSKSPLKMNAALVAGAGQTGKKFVDAEAEVASAFEEEEEPIAADLSKQEDVSGSDSNDKTKKKNKN